MPSADPPPVLRPCHLIRPPAEICVQAISGLSFADRARPGDVVGLDLRLFRASHEDPFQLSPVTAYWVMGSSGPGLCRLCDIQTRKLGRASFALAGLLDAEPYLEDLKIEARNDPALSASLHVSLVALRDVAILVDGQALTTCLTGALALHDLPLQCLVTADLSEIGDRMARRAAAFFLDTMSQTQREIPTTPLTRLILPKTA